MNSNLIKYAPTLAGATTDLENRVNVAMAESASVRASMPSMVSLKAEAKRMTERIDNESRIARERMQVPPFNLDSSIEAQALAKLKAGAGSRLDTEFARAGELTNNRRDAQISSARMDKVLAGLNRRRHTEDSVNGLMHVRPNPKPALSDLYELASRLGRTQHPTIASSN